MIQQDHVVRLHGLMHSDFIHYLVALSEASRAWDAQLFLAGGAVRALVWDDLHMLPPTRPADLDVAFFHRGEDSELAPRIEAWLTKKFPWAPRWEVKNQAVMHTYNGLEPFEDLEDAVAHWVDTASAVAVRFNTQVRTSIPEVIAPYGLGDLFSGIVRTPPGLEKLGPTVRQRVESKKWLERWPNLQIMI